MEINLEKLKTHLNSKFNINIEFNYDDINSDLTTFYFESDLFTLSF